VSERKAWFEEGSEIMDEGFEGNAMDAALASAAQRVERYEIARTAQFCAF